nr:MAG TPA: hypothetical protein [Caudoviricetes sp.]
MVCPHPALRGHLPPSGEGLGRKRGYIWQMQNW